MAFCDWLLSPSIMLLRFIRVVACERTAFFLVLRNIPLCGYTTCYLSIHQLLAFEFVYLLAAKSNAAINIRVHMFLLSFLVVYVWECNCWSYGNSMFILFRNCQAVFQSDCAILHSQQQCVRVPISPRPRRHLLSVSLIVAS